YAAVLAVDIFLANAVMILAFTWLGHAIPWKLPANLATFALAFVIVDFCHYWRHRISHKVHLLWCVHGVHHSSEELNFSTVLRLSPVE
ncbi:sterol desaturase family protein, partial [Acinetobacter baumannii]